jgi:hypothetical protein
VHVVLQLTHATRCSQEGFRGHTAAVHTGAPNVMALNHSHLHALGGQSGEQNNALERVHRQLGSGSFWWATIHYIGILSRGLEAPPPPSTGPASSKEGHAGDKAP